MAQNKLPSFFSEDLSSSPMFQNFQREMTQLLERFRNQPPTSMTDWMNAIPAKMIPALDVAETEDTIEVTAEIPGVSEDDIDVSIIGDVLVLKGEKSVDREKKEKDFHLVERSHGSFRRHVPLGFVPEEGAVDVTFGDGVLSLKIAKPVEAKPASQKIEIKKS